MGLYRQKAIKMDEGKIISLRMGTEEVAEMDRFLEGHPELGGRSLFIRTAVREYIARDARVPEPKVAVSRRDGDIAVRLMPADKETIAVLTDRGMFTDLETGVSILIHEKVKEMTKETDLVRSIYYDAALNDIEQ